MKLCECVVDCDASTRILAVMCKGGWMDKQLAKADKDVAAGNCLNR